MDEFTALGSLADPVRRQVYDYVAAQDEPVGREQTAAATGIALHTAKFHLERLVDEGLLTTEFRRLSGRTGPGAGRPAKLYCRAAVEVSVSVPPRSYDLVGSVLAGAVASSLDGKPLEEALRDEAHRRGHEAGASYAGTGKGLERIHGLMQCEGFEPTIEDAGLTLRNCPFDALAKEQPALVCGVNLDYVSGALEGLACDALRARLDPAEDRCCVRVGHDDEHEQRSRRTTDRVR
jgi:predicted ArsR family transcriptional regulator